MRILHCCLACFYVDSYGYQENILPKQHKSDGHEVEIMASTETYVDGKRLGYVQPSFYISESGIPVTRLAYRKFLPHFFMRKFRMYRGINNTLERFQPDIIFIHDCQFIDIRLIVKYARRNPEVKIFVDCHADSNNSAKNWLSKYILHKLIYRWCAKMIEPYTEKFYGVLPARCSFLHDVYGIAQNKIELLVMGAEDDRVHIEQRDEIRERLLRELNLRTNDFIIVTGGKFTKRKKLDVLLKAIRIVNFERIKLIVFGSMTRDVMEEVKAELTNPNVRYIGWLGAEKVYDYFIMSDLTVFTGLHSVLWEQALACGVPCVFSDMDGFHHVDKGGNCIFLKDGTAEEVADVLMRISLNQEVHSEMKRCAMHAAPHFLYSDIARRSIRAR